MELRDACFVGNVCQNQPRDNDIKNFSWDGCEIQEGIAQLTQDLKEFSPNLCLLLGNTPLKLFTGNTGISSWRGSLLRGQLGVQSYKCLAALHPAGILREYQGNVFLDFDLRRARQEGRTKELTLPQRDLRVGLSVEDQLMELDKVLEEKPTISIDLEGYWNWVHCMSIARSPYDSFLVDFEGTSVEDNARLLRKLCEVLSDPSIPKILQNAMYELFVMQYGYSVPIRGIVDDTMLMWWELFCELPKKLGVLSSVCTREPYWKGDRESEDKHTRDLYCCKDSAVTYEIRNVLKAQLAQVPYQQSNYSFNLTLQEALTYMQLQGICYDKEKATLLIKEKQDQVFRLQWTLNAISGWCQTKTKAEWLVICRDNFCFKKSRTQVVVSNDLSGYSKLTCLSEAQRAEELLKKETLTLSDQGELADLTASGLNVESSTQIPDFLYGQLRLPPQFKKVKGRNTTTLTADVGALLELYRKTQDPTLKLILKIRSLRSQLETLHAKTDPDGKMRCGYNLLKKETKKTNTSEGGPTATGRLSCTKSLTGSGYNLTTATRSQRCLFIPPSSDWWLGQCDLAGADGWTVAAHSAAYGDTTMLDDLNAGLKIAKNIAVIKEHGRSALQFTRSEFAAAGKKIDKDGWLYFSCKRVQHGSNYGMGKETMSKQILKDSFKLFGEPIFVSEETCLTLQQLYFQRYPGVLLWHARLKKQLLEKGFLVSSSGHKRIFFGRKKDPYGRVNHDTFKEMCAEEPQNNTTFATNLALTNLWKDQENWERKVPYEIQDMIEVHYDKLKLHQCRSDNENGYDPKALANSRKVITKSIRDFLRIQPVHTVHDSLVDQWRKELTDWARKKHHEWFTNPLTIAGQSIVIPFEGSYGPSWGELGQAYGGGVI